MLKKIAISAFLFSTFSFSAYAQEALPPQGGQPSQEMMQRRQQDMQQRQQHKQEIMQKRQEKMQQRQQHKQEMMQKKNS